MSERPVGVTALLRPALKPEEAARGVQIFHAKSTQTLSGKALERFVNRHRRGFDYNDFERGLIILREMMLSIAFFGMSAKLPGIGTITPVVGGKLEPGETDPKSKIKVSYRFRLEKDFRRELAKQMDCRFEPMVGRQPQLDAFGLYFGENGDSAPLTPGASVVITGKNLKYNPENPEEGVFFLRGGTEEIRVPDARIKGKSIVFPLPAELVPGKKYTLSVRIRFPRCRDLRTGVFAEKIVVRA